MIEKNALLELCRSSVRAATRLGADQAEVFATSTRRAEVELQQNDVHTTSSSDEASFGIRVFRAGSLGFATLNRADRIEEACRDALAMAAASPPDPLNGLDDPRPVAPLAGGDPASGTLEIPELVELAVQLRDAVTARDGRVRIDKGGSSSTRTARAIATSTGVALCEEVSSTGAHLFGMAVDGDDVGSFDFDSIAAVDPAKLAPQIDDFAARFVENCAGALGARKGESFRGTVILSPAVVTTFVLPDLLSILSGKAVRTGSSPLADKAGVRVAAPSLTLVDDGRLAGGAATTTFDREGTPTRRSAVLDRGVLGGFFYDTYEARAAGAEPTGQARGDAASLPTIGPANLVLEPGETPADSLCGEPERAVLVNRFSGATNPVTGEFSGVVKGGFLLRRGDRTPVRETLIAGNLFELLKNVSGVSKERIVRDGRAWVPALRVEDVSVTSG